MRWNGKGFFDCDNYVRVWMSWNGKGFSKCDNSVSV
jgi:hypothetical protein